MSTRQWPQDYQRWSGSFSELVHTAGEVVAAQDPQARKPTASLVRHYQQIGAVGRGEREGKAKTFTFEDLAAIVATKGLIKQGLGLGVASSLMNSASPALKIAYSDPKGGPAEAVQTVAAMMSQAGLSMPAQAAALRSMISPTPGRSAFSALSGGLEQSRGFCAPLMASAPMSPPVAESNSTAPAMTPTIYYVGGAPDALSGSKVASELKPAPWLTLYCDTQAMAAASAQERLQAAQALDTLAAQLRAS